MYTSALFITRQGGLVAIAQIPTISRQGTESHSIATYKFSTAKHFLALNGVARSIWLKTSIQRTSLICTPSTRPQRYALSPSWMVGRRPQWRRPG